MKAVRYVDLNDAGDHNIELPVGAEIIHFQCPHAMIAFWVIVDLDEKKTVVRRFRVVYGEGRPTFSSGGREVTVEGWRHLKSADNNENTFHLFEKEGG